MTRTCDLTAKKPLTGNNVSHSNQKTKRRQRPNLLKKTLHSDVLKRDVYVRISAAALRSVDRLGLDAYLLKADVTKLSEGLLRIRAQIEAATRF